MAGLTIAGDTASALYGTGQTICLGYHVTDMGVFLGMILGVVVALVHNRFIDTEFEGAMAMYGNSKFVFVVLLPIVLVMAVVASYVWPVAAAGINALTGVMASAGAFGVFLYGFLNRVLIPTGLHHLVWSPFLYSALGDSMIIGGEQIVGAKPVFLALLSDPSVAMMRDSARFLTYGLMKTFGVIGVAMAFISTAKKEKKAATKAQIIPATLTACLVGVTEPLEFTFLFAAPALWLVYSVLDGLFQMIVYLVGIRVCATNGIIDFLVLNLPAGIGRTRWPLYVLVGLVEIVVMYLVFREEVTDLAANAAAVKQQIRSGAAEKTAASANDAQTAAHIVEGLGGAENILNTDNCMTRLRVQVKDAALVKDKEWFKPTGSAGLVVKGNNIQIIYGPKVGKMRAIVDSYLGRAE